MQHSGDTVEGLVSIGIGETAAINELADAIKDFRNIYPGARFEIYTATADAVMERMENGLLDFGLMLDPVDISEYNFILLHSYDVSSVLLPEDHPLAAKKSISAKDLVGQPLIIPRRKSVQNMMENWFGKYSKNQDTPIIMNLSDYNKRALVRKGLGIGLSIYLENPGEGLVQRPLSPEIRTRCVLVWIKNRFHTTVVAKFAEFMEERYQENSEE